jgi:hypothetical protein
MPRAPRLAVPSARCASQRTRKTSPTSPLTNARSAARPLDFARLAGHPRLS